MSCGSIGAGLDLYCDCKLGVLLWEKGVLVLRRPRARRTHTSKGPLLDLTVCVVQGGEAGGGSMALRRVG